MTTILACACARASWKTEASWATYSWQLFGDVQSEFHDKSRRMGLTPRKKERLGLMPGWGRKGGRTNEHDDRFLLRKQAAELNLFTIDIEQPET